MAKPAQPIAPSAAIAPTASKPTQPIASSTAAAPTATKLAPWSVPRGSDATAVRPSSSTPWSASNGPAASVKASSPPEEDAVTAKTVVGGEGICKASWAALVGSNGADTPAATTLPGTVSQPIAASVTNDESQAALPAVVDKEALPAVVIDVVTSSTPANQGLEPPQAAIIVADEKASEANVTTAAVPKVTGAETPAEKEKEQKTDQKSEPAVVLSPAAPAFLYGDLTNEKRIVEWVLETRQL